MGRLSERREAKEINRISQVDLQPDLITYTCLLNCYETARQWQRALELFAVLPEIKAMRLLFLF